MNTTKLGRQGESLADESYQKKARPSSNAIIVLADRRSISLLVKMMCSLLWRLSQGQALILVTLNPLFQKNNSALLLLLLTTLSVQITWMSMLGLIS